MTTSVLVLGAGFGGLEVAARLSEELGDDADVTLVDRADAFVFGFAKLDVMFGRSGPDEIRIPYAGYSRRGVRFVQADITAIDPVARTATTSAGVLSGDVLVVALGAEYDVAATPGLAELGREFYSVEGAESLRDVLEGFEGGDVVIGVCGAPFKCPPAPNECALMLHDQLEASGRREGSTIRVVVPMGVPLPPVPDLTAALLDRYAERGIEFVADRRVVALEEGAAGREAVLDDGTRLPFDLFLGVPVHRVPAVVAESGLAEHGWIPVDRSTCATRFPDVYAVGDVTSVGTPKAGVFAEGAARVVADELLARIRGERDPDGYDGHGFCYVEMGRGEVGQASVDFFGGDHPHGWYTAPSAETYASKASFGSTRRARWFGEG